MSYYVVYDSTQEKAGSVYIDSALEIVMVDPRYYYDNVEQLMTQRGVTDVLFLYNFSTFSADTALADTLGAAS